MELGKLIKLSTDNKTTIPKEYTDKLGWEIGDYLNARLDGRSIVLQRAMKGGKKE